MAARTNRSLLTAILLACSGGLLDAVAYLLHHGVFASALNGNVVFLGISLIHRDRTDALRHAVPIAATLLGVFSARALRIEPPFRVARLSLLFESVLLALCGLLSGHVPGSAIVATAAFAGAFQMANFRRVDRFAYNSTFLSGNLRDLAEGAFEAIDNARDANAGTRRRGRAKVRDMLLISFSFLLGVVLGAALAHRFGDRAFWAAIPLVLAAGLSPATP